MAIKMLDRDGMTVLVDESNVERMEAHGYKKADKPVRRRTTTKKAVEKKEN